MKTITASFWFILGLIFLSLSTANAQSIAGDEEVKDLFDQPEKVRWTRHYQGLMDDMHDVVLSLGSDGVTYKGYIFFQRSEERFVVVGKVNKDSLFLDEIGKEGQVSGHILGKLNTKRIVADWQNVQKDMSTSLHMELMLGKDVDLQYCGENKWVQSFKGELGEAGKMEIVLQRQHKDFITGSLFIADKNETFKLKGQICSDSFKLNVVNDKMLSIGSLLCNIADDKLSGTLKMPDSTWLQVSFKKDNGLEVSCVEYTDFNSAFNALYPSIEGHTVFNDYIFNQVKAWLAQSRSHSIRTIMETDADKPEDRLSNRAYAWFDIAHISDKMVSGYLIGDNTWSGNFRKSFNFDLVNKEVVGYEDLFELTPRFYEFIGEKVAEAIGHKPFFEEPDFQSWLFNQDFDLIAIKQQGIEFSSKSNMIYGAHQVTISFEDLKPYFKIGNPLEYLYLADNSQGEVERN